MANPFKDYKIVVLTKGQRLSSKLSKAQMAKIGFQQDANIGGNHIFVFRKGLPVADMGYMLQGKTLYLDTFSAEKAESKRFLNQAERSLAEEMVAHAVKKHSPRELLWEKLSEEGGRAFIERAAERGDIELMPGGKKANLRKWAEPLLKEKVSFITRIKNRLPKRKMLRIPGIKRRL